MLRSFESRLAAHWQAILRTDPKRLFGADYKWIRQAALDDSMPQPGYVGRRYKVCGLVFVAGNPGGPKQRLGKEIGTEDQKQYELLTALRRAAPTKRLQAFRALNDGLGESMQSWNISAKYVQAVIKDLVEFSEISFINLVKWRTVDERMPRGLLKKSWDAHTRDQLQLLQPSLVICLGKTIASPFMNQNYSERAHLITIPRTRKDAYVSEQAKVAIYHARRYLHNHR
jgi:hypothetical protein